jgi:hypothetical protein
MGDVFWGLKRVLALVLDPAGRLLSHAQVFSPSSWDRPNHFGLQTGGSM